MNKSTPTISFDIGGVIDKDPKYFKKLFKILRKDYRIIIVTAIGSGSIIPKSNAARQGFSIGRLYQMKLYYGEDYDECYTTMDHGSGRSETADRKIFVLERTDAIVHVDDNEHYVNMINSSICYSKAVWFTGDKKALIEDLMRFEVVKKEDSRRLEKLTSLDVPFC